MALDWLLDPVSDAAPCGPDLEQTDDPEFLDYYFEAEGRLPDRYFTPGVPNLLGGAEDQLFDPRSILIRRESDAITALLQRSRDLRLLSLLARFQILAARPVDFAATLTAMAALLAARIDDVHPQIAHAVSERRGALDALSEQTTVIMPLIHLPLLQNASINYRSYLVATGASAPRSSEAESEATAAEIVSILKNPANAAPLATLHDALTRAALALRQISTLCRGQGASAFSPDFSGVLTTITDVQSLIIEAWPEWKLWSQDAAPEPEIAVAPREAEQDLPEPAAAAQLPAARAVQVSSHMQARLMINAAETYLARNEPSSLSLLLVTQARLLVGKTLVDAIELLRPHEAEQARFDLGATLGFSLDMSRLRELAQSAAIPQGDSTDLAETKPVVIADRGQLASCLRGVEEFYLSHEPASPVPVLLASARNRLTKTFDAILAEIMPQMPNQS